MLRRLDWRLALLALLFNLVAIAVESSNLLNQFAPLWLLTGGMVEALGEASAQALAYAALCQFSTGFGINLTFFGFFCLVIGYLIHRSRLLPRILGIGMAIAEFCYLTNSFSLFTVPAFASLLFPWVFVPS